jgi:multidrug resistance efflux pump
LVTLFLVTTSSLLWGHHGGRAGLDLQTVRCGPLRGKITVRGSLAAARNTDVVCRVKSLSRGRPTTIRWIIEDGSPVRAGDLLVQLDDSELSERLRDQRVSLDLAQTAWVQAEKDHDIVVSQNKSDEAAARLALELAVIDLEKYTGGEYPQLVLDVEGRIKQAQLDLAMWEERAAWSGRMARPGRRYVSTSQVTGDTARLKAAKVALAKVVEEKRVLTAFTGPRTIKQLTGQVDEARRAVERVRIQARAKEIRDDRIRRARFRIYQRALSRYTDLEAEIKKCRIVAPHGGLAVYDVSAQARAGAGAQQGLLAQGEPVREGQRLMRLPDLGGVVVQTVIHEASVGRVCGQRRERTGFCELVGAALLFDQPALGRLGGQAAFAALRDELEDQYKEAQHKVVAEGSPAEVRVEAFPDHPLDGEVLEVSAVPARLDPWSDDVSVYPALVSVKEPLPGWKPGMSAAVTIFTNSERRDCLAVPVQAILGGVEMGGRRRVYVWTEEEGPVCKDVVVGQSDGKLAEVVSGLCEGEQIVVNPSALPDEP